MIKKRLFNADENVKAQTEYGIKSSPPPAGFSFGRETDFVQM